MIAREWSFKPVKNILECRKLGTSNTRKSFESFQKSLPKTKYDEHDLSTLAVTGLKRFDT